MLVAETSGLPLEFVQRHQDAITAGIKPFEPYCLRHTALTRLAEAGCDAFTLARIAGHSSITITQRYCHPQAEAVERAFAKVGRWAQFWAQRESITPSAPKRERCNTNSSKGISGERGRNRTFNLLIKSQLLCQLSYAPFPEDERTRSAGCALNIAVPSRGCQAVASCPAPSVVCIILCFACRLPRGQCHAKIRCQPDNALH